jgi:hypothetical protein
MSENLKIAIALVGFIGAFILNEYSFQKNSINIISYNTSPVWHSPLLFFEKKQHILPVVYLQVNPDDFFSYNTGIYIRGNKQFCNAKNPLTQKWWDWPANYHTRGKASERPALINYSENNTVINTNIKVKIHGNKTRAFPQKSILVKFTKNNYPVLFNHPVTSIILRNSGNDWGRTLFADALAHQIMQTTSLDIQPYKHVILYLNNEYWGIHNLTVKTDENYLAQKYNFKKKHITLIESEGLKAGKKEIADEFYDLINKLQNPIYNNEEKYKFIEQKVDIEKFNIYMIFQIYFANTDWPHNNLRVYKIKSKKINSKWCFIPYDMDYSFAYTGSEAVKKDMFHHVLNFKNNHVSIIFKQLLLNNDYVKTFKNQFEDYLNTTLSTDYQLHILDSIRNNLTNEISCHIARWRKPASIEQWNEYVDANRIFILNREKYIRQHINKYLN